MGGKGVPALKTRTAQESCLGRQAISPPHPGVQAVTAYCLLGGRGRGVVFETFGALDRTKIFRSDILFSRCVLFTVVAERWRAEH